MLSQCPYFVVKHFELISPLSPADQLAAISCRHPRVHGDPFQQVPIEIRVVIPVVLLTLLLSKTLVCKGKRKRRWKSHTPSVLWVGILLRPRGLCRKHVARKQMPCLPLGGHSSVLHDSYWTLWPSQYLPPFLGRGLLHSLLEKRTPPSHVLEQAFQGLQGPQFPSTAGCKTQIPWLWPSLHLVSCWKVTFPAFREQHNC